MTLSIITLPQYRKAFHESRASSLTFLLAKTCEMLENCSAGGTDNAEIG